MKAANSTVNIEDLDAKMLQFLSDLENKLGYEPVSYTHLTLPTTPYV